ncbi:hypothetical protein GOP47_0023792, partial [Adiantum capillus-veneris]
ETDLPLTVRSWALWEACAIGCKQHYLTSWYADTVSFVTRSACDICHHLPGGCQESQTLTCTAW